MNCKEMWKIASLRKYNTNIPEDEPMYPNGIARKNGFEHIMRLTLRDLDYRQPQNAYIRACHMAWMYMRFHTPTDKYHTWKRR